MIQLRARKATSVIGVHFGTCSLRAVQLRRQAGVWHIHHWANLETEPAVAEPPSPHAPEELDLAFGPGTFSGRRTTLSLSPPDVDYQLLDLPSAVLAQPPAQLRMALQVELDRQMPWPIAESEIAAWPIKPNVSGKSPAMVVAARRVALESQLRMLADRGLRCERADIVPNAMIHLRQHARALAADTPENVVWGLLDIGFHSCRLYLVHADRPVYARVLRHGGRELTETLAKALHVDFAVAEKYKRAYGIQATDRGFRAMLGGISKITQEDLPGVLHAILRPSIESITHEIERSYRFAMGQLPGAAAGPLYLIGGGARLQGLIEVLSSHLGVPVCLPDPQAVFGPAGHGIQEHPALSPAHYCVLAPCVGLALNEEPS